MRIPWKSALSRLDKEALRAGPGAPSRQLCVHGGRTQARPPGGLGVPQDMTLSQVGEGCRGP